MTFAPQSILQVRRLIQGVVPSLSNSALGIVGSVQHANTGTSYHLGKGDLRSSAYSVIESSRDRAGLSEAASGLDVGMFTVRGKTLRDMSKWIVAECEAGAPDTKDIREIIYTADGQTVKRWDRLKVRSSGDDSHLTHTHFSWFRDSESRDKTSIFRRWFVKIGALEDDDVTPEDLTKIGALIAASEARIKAELLSGKTGSKAYAGRTRGDFERDLHGLRDYLVGDVAGTVHSGVTASSPVRRGIDAIARIEQKIDALTALPEISTDALLAAIREEFRDIIKGGAE